MNGCSPSCPRCGFPHDEDHPPGPSCPTVVGGRCYIFRPGAVLTTRFEPGELIAQRHEVKERDDGKFDVTLRFLYGPKVDLRPEGAD